MTNSITTFEAGSTYQMRFIGDSQLIVNFTVVRRNEKSVWIKRQNSSEVIRKAIKVHNGAEYCLPEGAYSMAPVLSATRKA